MLFPDMIFRGENMSGYRAMWLFVMFDLPMKSADDRKRYTQFRRQLLRLGFSQIQLSIYICYFGSQDATASVRNAVMSKVPDEGRVRILSVTDRQFGKMEIAYGKKKHTPEDPPLQILLF